MTELLAINRLKLAGDYLERLNESGYEIIDLNMIEPFQLEDKKYHPSNIVFERNQALYAIRSDWTRSLVNYQSRYYLNSRKFGYFGPVLREFKTIYQAGTEIYDVSKSEIKESILLHLSFVKDQTSKDLRTFIVNDEKLIDLYIKKYELSESVKPLIFDKDISALEERLGREHPLYQLMITPVSRQFSLVKEEFGNSQPLQFITELKNVAEEFKADFILDLSYRTPQGYYNGFYFQVFLNENAPVLSGGEYNHQSFGIAVNLSNGGLL